MDRIKSICFPESILDSVLKETNYSPSSKDCWIDFELEVVIKKRNILVPCQFNMLGDLTENAIDIRYEAKQHFSSRIRGVLDKQTNMIVVAIADYLKTSIVSDFFGQAIAPLL